jgi:hypothetical protein
LLDTISSVAKNIAFSEEKDSATCTLQGVVENGAKVTSIETVALITKRGALGKHLRSFYFCLFGSTGLQREREERDL